MENIIHVIHEKVTHHENCTFLMNVNQRKASLLHNTELPKCSMFFTNVQRFMHNRFC